MHCLDRFSYKFICILYLLVHSFCYSLQIAGRILDEKREPLENVIIFYEERIDISDEAGKYSLQIAEPNRKIRFHKIGYEDINIPAVEITAEIIMKQIPLEQPGIDVYGETSDYSRRSSADRLLIEVPDQAGLDTADFLSRFVFIHIKGSNLTGERKSVSLLGHKSRHTCIMLDGITLNPSGQAFDLSSLPLEMIEEIEIVKNNDQKGSGAMGGSINFLTRKTESSWRSSLSQTFGSFGLTRTNSISSFSKSGFDSFLHLAHTGTNNDFHFKQTSGVENNLENNDKSIWDLNLKLSKKIFFFQTDYKFDLQDYDKKFLTSENIDIYDESFTTGKIIRHQAAISGDIGNSFYGFEFFHFKENSNYDNTASNWFPIESHHFQVSGGINSMLSYRLKNLSGDLSLQYRREDFSYKNETNPAADIDPQFRKIYTASTNFILKKDFFPFRLDFDLSGYLGKYSDFGYFPTYRIGSSLILETAVSYALGGNYGTGFTIPSFYDLYWNDAQAKGNNNLNSETSRGWLAYFQIQKSEHLLKISYSQDLIQGLIHWSRQTDYWRPANIAAARISNLEIETEFALLKNLSTQISYLQTYANDRTPQGDFYGKFLTYIPQYKFVAAALYSYKFLFVRLFYEKYGRQYTTRDQLSAELIMPEYDLLNIETAVDLHIRKMKIRLGLDLNNVFDKEYELYKYMPQPGRNWRLSLSVGYAGK